MQWEDDLMGPGSELQARGLHRRALGAAGDWEASGDGARLAAPGDPSQMVSCPLTLGSEATRPDNDNPLASQSCVHPVPQGTLGSAQDQAPNTGPGRIC